MGKILRQKNLILLLFLVSVLVLPFLIVSRKSYAISDDIASFSVSDRELLQSYVTSTAKHYLYKNTYTDYEQHSMDDTLSDVSQSTFRFRSFVTEPEQLNKTNRVNFDCSSFVTNVYMNAFGYHFGDYYSMASNKAYYFSTEYKYYKVNSGANYFRYGMLNTGNGVSTFMLDKIATSKIGSVGSGTIYHGDATTDLVPFYYQLTNSENSSKVKEVYADFESYLQNGDVFVIRYTKDGATSGHTMIYVDDMINTNGNRVSGFIHSTGKDFDFSNSSVGEDAYSVRFMSYDEFKTYSDASLGYLFAPRSNGKVPTSVELIRPINEVIKGEYTNFYDNTSHSLLTSKNTIAREAMPYLRAEEYVSVKIGSSYKNVSKYQSAFVGEEIKYSLDLKSTISDGYTVSVSGTIPSNTSYVGCSNQCVYHENTGEITWENVNVTTSSKTLSYSVKINSGENTLLTNSGMKITSDGKSLTMGDSSIGVSPTYRLDEREKLINAIDEMKSAIGHGYLVIDSDALVSNYKTKISSLNENNTISMTAISSLKSLYYNAYDLDIKTISTYKDAIFNTIDNGYVRKTDGSVDKNNVNLMVVDGLYGGRKVRGNVDKKRTTLVTLDDLEIGDLVMPGAANNAFIFLGKNPSTSLYEVIDTNLVVHSGDSAKNLFRGIFTYDTFVVLRPSKVYGSKLHFDYQDGVAVNSTRDTFVTIGSTYGKLPDANRKVNVTLDYNGATSGNAVTTLVAENRLEGWYLDDNFINKITETSIVGSSKYQNLYAKYNEDKVLLPTPLKDGYLFTGWYTGIDTGEKVGNGGDSVLLEHDATLYARYEKIDATFVLSDIYTIDQTKNEIVFRVDYALYSDFISHLQSDSRNTIKVFTRDGVEITTGVIPTGSKVRVYSGDTVIREYTNILIGDVNGDGRLALADIMTLANYVYKNRNLLDGVYLKAADYNQDSNYSLSDIMQLANRIYN